MDKTITLLAHNRPAYTRQVLDALARCSTATYWVLRHAFVEADYVVHSEDDIVPASDCLRYFEWAGQAYRDDRWTFSVSAFGLPDGRDGPLTPAAFRAWAWDRAGLGRDHEQSGTSRLWSRA